jgi:hypothetical protein
MAGILIHRNNKSQGHLPNLKPRWPVGMQDTGPSVSNALLPIASDDSFPAHKWSIPANWRLQIHQERRDKALRRMNVGIFFDIA